jgi:hypothetical protein
MGKYLNKIRQAELAHQKDRPEDQEGISVNPAHPRGRQMYWEDIDGRILGPVVPEHLAKVRTRNGDSFWVIVTYDGLPRWIRSDRLRSKQAFETQRPVQTIEPIREVWSGK